MGWSNRERTTALPGKEIKSNMDGVDVIRPVDLCGRIAVRFLLTARKFLL